MKRLPGLRFAAGKKKETSELYGRARPLGAATKKLTESFLFTCVNLSFLVDRRRQSN